MAAWFPTRRVLGLPAWFWVVLPVPLLWYAGSLWRVWPPTKLAEPPARAEIFRELVLVAPEGDSFRFVPFGEHKGVKPLWAVNVSLRDSGTVRWRSRYFLPGLFERESRWTYELSSHRFDDDWKGDKVHPFALPDEQLRRLRPLVVAELNRRSAPARSGDRLEGLLTDGLTETSYRCLQNGIIVLSWVSIPMAVVGLVALFVRPRSASIASAPAIESHPEGQRPGR